MSESQLPVNNHIIDEALNVHSEVLNIIISQLSKRSQFTSDQYGQREDVAFLPAVMSPGSLQTVDLKMTSQ